MMKMIYLLVFFLLLLAPIGQAMDEESWESRFDAQIKQWITELSSGDQQFQQWKEATYNIEALGPNSRQWMVTILNKGETVGYMIVGADAANQLYLQEYGLGEMSLFDSRVLDTYYPDLMKIASAITKVYQGLESYFLVDTDKKSVIIDAKTGEIIPEEFTDKKGKPASLFFSGKTTSVEESFLKPLSNLEEAFPLTVVLGKAKRLEALDQIKKQDVYLNKNVWNNNIRLLTAVAGYHIWQEGTVFIALNQEGYRFLPLVDKKIKTDGDSPSVLIDDMFISDAVGVGDKPLLLTSLPHE